MTMWIATLVSLLGNPEAEVLARSVEIAGETVECRVVVPDGFDPGKAYPAILAFPPGSQAADMVEFSLEDIWGDEAEARGYLVFIPEAPGGDWFFQEGSRVFPALLDHLLETYPIEGGLLHAAGPSNGGRSALYAAADHPSYFRTVTVFPGYLPLAGDVDASPLETDVDRIRRLEGLCIRMFVGGEDRPWREMMEPQADQFAGLGLDVSLTVEEGQGHLPRTLVRENARRLFETIEGCGSVN